ncbi:hypothetical protein OC845_003190 [Tilletia horrida]|nr:hypothetical protein OC845_003190 [Tilletia horrida]
MVRGLSRLLHIHPSVRGALASQQQPCVALESTIVTHGLPWPQNLETAIACEDAIRAEGAVPATIALLDGQAHVGLSRDQLERVARSTITCPPPERTTSNAFKVSRRDLAYVLAAGPGSIGGTTVSATLVLARHAGISIFATGGIGGVHRGAPAKLSRTPLAVFCSGAKSILSLPHTLEYLETAGVTVVTFDQHGRFPAFYSADSGLHVPKVKDCGHAARIIHSSQSLGLQNGIVFGVPVPESHAAAGQEIQGAVERAIQESIDLGIDRKGKEVTPWLLARVSQLAPKALESNKALVVNNSRMAAKTAVQLHRLRVETGGTSAVDLTLAANHSAAPVAKVNEQQQDQPPAPPSGMAEVLVIGCAAVDIIARSTIKDPLASAATTYPGAVTLCPGGVARNIAEAASRLLLADKSPQCIPRPNASSVMLIAPIANDAFGDYLVEEAERSNMRSDGLFRCLNPQISVSSNTRDQEPGQVRTAVCSLTLDGGGDLIHGVADFDITSQVGGRTKDHSDTDFNSFVRTSIAERLVKEDDFTGTENQLVVAFDANLTAKNVATILQEVRASTRTSAGRKTLLLYEPTSVPKCGSIWSAMHHLLQSADGAIRPQPIIDVCTPTVAELIELRAAAFKKGLIPITDRVRSWHAAADYSSADATGGLLPEVVEALEDMSLFFRHIFLKRGKEGALVCSRHPAPPVGLDDFIRQNSSQQHMSLQVSLHPVPVQVPAHLVVNTTGAGDTFVGALVAAISRFGPPHSWSEQRLSDVVNWAQRAAACTVQSSRSVAAELGQISFQT